MSRRPIRIRTFILAGVLVLLLAPTLAGGAAWVIERHHQEAGIQGRLDSAVGYLTTHRAELRAPATVRGFARLLDQLDLLAQLVVVTSAPPGKDQVYVSPALSPVIQKQQAQTKARKARTTPAAAPTGANPAFSDHRQVVSLPGSRTKLVADLFYRAPSRTTRALVALVSGVFVLFAGLAIVVWLAGRWMVTPLARLSAQVDKVAGGDLAIAIPHSRIAEIANIAQAVDGMTDALGETAQRRAEADEARRFLVTSIAHDLRTPLFALRGHLQAIGTRLGNPAVHLERAEARADALERLIGNLFAYTSDDYGQPAPRLEAVPVADLLQEVVAGLEHATRLQGTTFELAGDQASGVIVDRDRFRRALTNILDNALRHSPRGAPIHITCAAPDAATVQITIQDHGPGIDPELLPHIFEPGIRGTRAVGSPDDGAGLGLTIAKRLLEHQHATVTAHNQPAGGTLVRVTLQRQPSADAS